MRPTPVTQSLIKLDGPPLVLASGSAARASMLRGAGVPFSVARPAVDEESFRESLAAEGVTTRDAAVALGELKARQVSVGVTDDRTLVVGADQILEHEGQWLEKPRDRAAARKQLLRLSGSSHRLVSAVVAFRGGSRIWAAHDVAKLVMRPLSEEFIDAYLDAVGEEVFHSVGAYQLEGLGVHLMARVEGDYFTILGMPLIPLLQFLRDQGVVIG